MKRSFDVIFSLIFSLIFFIPILIVAILIKATSPGPVIFWSDRVGQNNKIFKMPKFRTMRVETPNVATHLLQNPNLYQTKIGPILRKLSLDEMTGGTFTITNGGVFGSLLSTPIINPPQVAILGMHKIQERPVGINGKIELRPMMNLAVSYDHRIVDGKESVSFLVSVIEMLENPAFLLSDGKNPAEVLLGL